MEAGEEAEEDAEGEVEVEIVGGRREYGSEEKLILRSRSARWWRHRCGLP